MDYKIIDCGILKGNRMVKINTQKIKKPKTERTAERILEVKKKSKKIPSSFHFGYLSHKFQSF
jgi:hypothetical protein